MVIAIDGPAGAGKSTVALALAARLGFTYLDSGAMYRCVALLALDAPGQEPAALARAARIELAAADRTDGPQAAQRAGAPPARVILDGVDVSDAIREPRVSDAASRIASDPGVRAALVAKQRELLAHGDWVAEGRDIGTVVAPDAGLKVFLTADAGVRAQRRADELGAEQAIVLAEQRLRDERDSTREHSPLRPAAGAITLDTSGLAAEEVVTRIAELARRRPAGA